MLDSLKKRVNQFIIKLPILILLFTVICSTTGFAQEVEVVDETDTASIIKLWLDDNGDNKLYINVGATCNNYDSKGLFPKRGYPSVISVELENDEHHIFAEFADRHYDREMLMFYDEAIWFTELNEKQAVFIPVFYCTVFHGNTMPLTYIVLYDGKRYLYHFDYQCEPSVLGKCRLPYTNKELSKRLSNLPKPLESRFTDYLRKVYTTREDLFPNHATFDLEKYHQTKKPFDLATAYNSSYPYVLLDKVNTYLVGRRYSLALTYLEEFEYLYVRDPNIVDVAGFYVQDRKISGKAEEYKPLVLDNPQELLDKAKVFTEYSLYQEAYLIYKTFIEEIVMLMAEEA
ncbi:MULTISPECIES: hypothetical protein [unclassified Myroides]|uniref:hypothetical protein n=1 Tax=unclassified Myroides TaxID=2642485 RepID=UPI003101A7A9